MKGIFNNRSICRLLATLSSRELREFGAYIQFKGRKKNVELWAILRKSHPDFQISDQAIYKKILPGKPFKDAVFRVWVAELYKLARNFVAFQEFEQNDYLHSNLLSLALLRRRDELTYLKARRDAENRCQADAKRSVANYQYLHQMEDYHYQYFTLFHHRKLTDSLQRAADSYDLSFLATKLKYFTVMRNRSHITGEQYDYRLEAEILAYLAENPMQEAPIIHLYRLLLQLQKDMQNSYRFQEFIHYFLANKAKIEAAEARQLLGGVNNIAHWNIQNGLLAYLEIRFQCIKILADEGLALVENSYPIYHFRNIMHTAILAGELEWATSFLAENIDKTLVADRQNLSVFFRAYLHFAKGEYEQQAQYMAQMAALDFKFTDIQTNIYYRLLAIKTAYQKLTPDAPKMLLASYKSHMNAFRLFIKNKENISAEFRLSCKHFHKALSLIYNKNFLLKNQVEDYRQLILELKPIVELPWLLTIL